MSLPDRVTVGTQTAPLLFGYPRYWAECFGTAPFLAASLTAASVTFIALYQVTCEERGDTPLPISGATIAAIRARIAFGVRVAAFALAAGRYAEALALTDRAIPVVERAENAALLSTLLMMRSEANRALGRDTAAREARLDSLGWARYGFGTDAQVRARLSDIAGLAAAGFQSWSQALLVGLLLLVAVWVT